MNWIFSGEPVTIPLDLEVEGDFVVPDSAIYTVRGADYLPLSNHTDVTVTPTDSRIAITVLGADNTLASGLYGWRWINVRFSWQGESYSRGRRYGITNWLPLDLSPSLVREALGISQDELPDRQVDLFYSFTKLSSEVGETLEQLILVSPEVFSRLLVVQTVLDVLPSLALRAKQVVKEGDMQVSRFTGLNVGQLVGNFQGQKATLMAELVGVSDPVPIEHFSVSAPTDPVTNA
jgi:hypothetical protein